MALVLKVEDSQLLFEYRPISSVRSLYKIIAELLANKLRLVVGKLVSNFQTVFIPGRQIQDGIVVLNKLIAYARRKRKKCLLLKVDFAKAYENVN